MEQRRMEAYAAFGEARGYPRAASADPGRFQAEWDEAEWAGLDWEEEIRRGSPQYIAWVQDALNQVLRTTLGVDGKLGAGTRNAIRDFQRRQGLKTDGKVGPITEQALVKAVNALSAGKAAAFCATVKRPEILDRFDFDNDKVKPHQQPRISRIAQCVVARGRGAGRVRGIRIVGHTDPVGTGAYNLDLGRRRAEQVKKSLQDTLDLLSPGASAGIAFTIETRGEGQPIPGDPARSRRVEVHLPPPPKPPARKGCPPHKSRIRLHLKILVPPTRVSIANMIASMRQVYGPAGFRVEIASRETLRLPTLEELDVACPDPARRCQTMPCANTNLNAEHVALYGHRNHVRANEIVVYFVRRTVPGLNGICDHPPGRPGVVVTARASRWTLAHEVGHVLGLSHVADNDRLMTGGGTDNITNPPPDLVRAEIQTMDRSTLTIPC